QTINKQNKNIYYYYELSNYEYLDPDNNYILLDKENIIDSTNNIFEPETPNTNTTTTSKNTDENIVTSDNIDENIINNLFSDN
ncbi:3482_t:CDS:1, partial [Scutellospora calospora]